MAADDDAIRQFLDSLETAWAQADAQAFGARYRDDGTFTNVFGTLHTGRDEFIRRHDDVLRGFLKGTRIGLAVRSLRFVRPDVAIADVDVSYTGFATPPAGVKSMADGLVHSSLLMVLVKERGDWWISAYHNVWRA